MVVPHPNWGERIDCAEFNGEVVFFGEIDFNSFLPVKQAKATLKCLSATTFGMRGGNYLRHGRLSYCQNQVGWQCFQPL